MVSEQDTEVQIGPKCPSCGVEGVEHFVSKESKLLSRYREPWFYIVHCDKCGHVYNVIAKHVFALTSTRVVMPSDGSK